MTGKQLFFAVFGAIVLAAVAISVLPAIGYGVGYLAGVLFSPLGLIVAVIFGLAALLIIKDRRENKKRASNGSGSGSGSGGIGGGGKGDSPGDQSASIEG